MTRKILNDLGGSVSIKSEPDQGTTVTLLLPPFFAWTRMSAMPNEKVIVLATRNAGKSPSCRPC
jgi:hypothetical protein